MDAIVVMASGALSELVPMLSDRLRLLNPDKLVVVADTVNLPRMSSFAWAKAWQWDLVPRDVDRLLYLDADTFPLCPFPEFPDTDFAAALDHPKTKKAETPLLLRNGVSLEDCDGYFNSGVMFSSRRAKPMFDELKEHVNDARSKTKDQFWLNVLAPRHGFFDRLPWEWNYLFEEGKDAPPGTIVVHFAGIPNSKRIPRLKGLFGEIREEEEGKKYFSQNTLTRKPHPLYDRGRRESK